MNLKHATEEYSFFNNSLTYTNRRRSLFPSDMTDSESDSDLGHISPLNFDSSFEHEEFKPLSSKESQNVEVFEDTVGEYDILGILQTDNTEETVPSLYLSPLCRKPCLSQTPKTSPTNVKLKTPHDTSNTNSKLPKLSRKSLIDSIDVSNKRKLSPDKSPEHCKQIKLDSKSSRVRTTLFPEVDFALSTKLFYPKIDFSKEKCVGENNKVSKTSVPFTKNQKSRRRRRIGQINAGVGHKIRKPKLRKSRKLSPVNKKLNEIEKSTLADYVDSMKKIQQCIEAPKLIENKENTAPVRQITPAVGKLKQITEIKDTRKRPLSPEQVPDPNKKFFKFSRGKGVVKMNKSIQLEMDHGKLTLIDKNKPKNQGKQNFLNCLNDLKDDEPLLKTNIENIIFSLEEDAVTVPEKNKIVLHAHNSVVASENSILLHQPKVAANLILSPISQMCDVTSGLALDSPKKIRNLTPILDGMTDSTKLYPVFYPQTTKPAKTIEKASINTEKKFKKLSESQMLLDAGQKKFGATQCPECNIVYHMGDPSDELMHLNHHTALNILRFPGWKKERVVADYQDDGRIIQLIPDDSKIWWKKVNDLLDIINRDIGCYNVDFPLDQCQAFLYIKKKTIVGCLIATRKTEGYKLLSSIDSDIDLCSEEKYPIKCGVPRIWVTETLRKQGIATKMMNALKRNFILGFTLNNNDIAFSSPTETGKQFAQSYFKTNNFYIYFS